MNQLITNKIQLICNEDVANGSQIKMLVIMSVYNAGDCIYKCLDAIVSPKLREIVVIN